MTSKHTPGPWRVEEYTSGNQHFGFTPACAVMCRDNNKVICEIPDYTTGQHDVEDARLIAAAPELLRALQAVVNDCHDLDMVPSNERGRTATAFELAVSAIAKATGEST